MNFCMNTMEKPTVMLHIEYIAYCLEVGPYLEYYLF